MYNSKCYFYVIQRDYNEIQQKKKNGKCDQVILVTGFS